MRRYFVITLAMRVLIVSAGLLAASCRPPIANQSISASPLGAPNTGSPATVGPRPEALAGSIPQAPDPTIPANANEPNPTDSPPEEIPPEASQTAAPADTTAVTTTRPAPAAEATKGSGAATVTPTPVATFASADTMPTPPRPVASRTPTSRMAAPALPTPAPGAAPFPGTLLVADASNHRLLEIKPDGQVVWQFPAPGTPAPPGWFRYPDDAFFSPDGRYVAVSEETNQVVVVIDYQTREIVWRFGVPRQAGRDLQHLNYPDDARVLPDGRVAVADIRNCRILLISWDQQDVQALGTPGDCSGRPGSFAEPNAVEPLPGSQGPGGGSYHLLITEIKTHRVSEIDLQGHVIRAVTLPLNYPSDAFLTPRDTLIVADYHTPGRVIEADWSGRILWSFPPPGSTERLNRPSIATELPNGNIAICDDHRHRVLIVDRDGRVVWQYGVTDVPGSAPGYLIYPDGFDLHLPAPTSP